MSLKRLLMINTLKKIWDMTKSLAVVASIISLLLYIFQLYNGVNKTIALINTFSLAFPILGTALCIKLLYNLSIGILAKKISRHINLLSESHYAATVFIIRNSQANSDQAEMLFFKDVYEKTAKNLKPLGGRLPRNAEPEKYIELIIRETTGIIRDDYNYCTFKGHEITEYKDWPDENTHVKKRPIIIQKEHNIQRNGVPHHLDFIYLVELKNYSKSNLKNNLQRNRELRLEPDWYTMRQIENAIRENSFYYDSTKKLTEFLLNRYKKHEIVHQV